MCTCISNRGREVQSMLYSTDLRTVYNESSIFNNLPIILGTEQCDLDERIDRGLKEVDSRELYLYNVFIYLCN